MSSPSAPSAPPPTVVSAPGKVLLAGGYLVLDPAYSGVVVSTSSRFYTVIDARARAPSSPDSASDPDASSPIQIRVRSPQFEHASWLYAVHFDGPAAVRVDPLPLNPDAGKNKFVHLALHRTLTLAAERRSAGTLQNALGHGLDITIVGDNDFYSQRAQLEARNLPSTLASLSALPPFLPTGVPLAAVHKTGLGSSAALITSLTAALLLRLGVVPPSSFAPTASGVQSEGRKLAHNLAQYVHCLAQGKVGSGFDVSAAVFGSQIYRRFQPAVLTPLMSDTLDRPLDPILSPSNPAWDHHVAPFRLPPQTRLLLADVDAGSDTPSLVGTVLKWRAADPAAAKTRWDALGALNTRLAERLKGMGELEGRDPVAYRKAVKYISTIQSVQWLANPNITDNKDHAAFKEVIEAFVDAHQITEAIRTAMRTMGALARAPLEPPSQTALLDASVAVAGVVGGGVPGAGGFDAVWLLACAPPACPPEERPEARVERVWATFGEGEKGKVDGKEKVAKVEKEGEKEETGEKGKEEGATRVSPLLATESDAPGLRIERLEDVRGLREIVDAVES